MTAVRLHVRRWGTLLAALSLAATSERPARAPHHRPTAPAGRGGPGGPGTRPGPAVVRLLPGFGPRHPVRRPCSCRSTTTSPAGATTEVALLKVPATDPARKIGTLFLNPGGPGGSGVQHRRRGAVLPAPRCSSGSTSSASTRAAPTTASNVQCFREPRRAGERAGRAATSRSRWATRRRRLHRLVEGFGIACSTTGTPLSGSMSTAEVARDMDVLRRTVGDQRLPTSASPTALPGQRVRQPVPGPGAGGGHRRRARPGRVGGHAGDGGHPADPAAEVRRGRRRRRSTRSSPGAPTAARSSARLPGLATRRPSTRDRRVAEGGAARHRRPRPASSSSSLTYAIADQRSCSATCTRRRATSSSTRTSRSSTALLQGRRPGTDPPRAGPRAALVEKYAASCTATRHPSQRSDAFGLGVPVRQLARGVPERPVHRRPQPRAPRSGCRPPPRRRGRPGVRSAVDVGARPRARPPRGRFATRTPTPVRSRTGRRPVLVVGNYWDPATNYDGAVTAASAAAEQPPAVQRQLGSHRLRHLGLRDRRGGHLPAPGATPAAGTVCTGDVQPFTVPLGTRAAVRRAAPERPLPPVVPPLPGALPRELTAGRPDRAGGRPVRTPPPADDPLRHREVDHPGRRPSAVPAPPRPAGRGRARRAGGSAPACRRPGRGRSRAASRRGAGTTSRRRIATTPRTRNATMRDPNSSRKPYRSAPSWAGSR